MIQKFITKSKRSCQPSQKEMMLDVWSLPLRRFLVQFIQLEGMFSLKNISSLIQSKVKCHLKNSLMSCTLACHYLDMTKNGYWRLMSSINSTSKSVSLRAGGKPLNVFSLGFSLLNHILFVLYFPHLFIWQYWFVVTG